MASEIRVNKINSQTGVGTITLSPTGVDISGITTASTLRATTGIITTLQVGTISGDGSSLTGVAATDNVRTGILDVAGVGTFRNDVNIADKIIHLGDTNTAIRFPSADTITAETGGSERLRIASNGRVGINETSPDRLLHISGGSGDAQIVLQRSNSASNTNDYGRIYFESSSDVLTGQISVARESGEDNGYMHFKTASGGTLGERLRITSGGKLLGGNYFTSQQIGDVTAPVQIQGTSADTSALSLFRYSNDTGGSRITLGKGRGTSGGAADKPQENDTVGTIHFHIANNNDLVNGNVAAIDVQVDAEPGGGDTPGRIRFLTSPDGSSTLAERMRIHSNGQASFGTTDNGYGLTVINTSVQSNPTCFMKAEGFDNVEVLRLQNDRANSSSGVIAAMMLFYNGSGAKVGSIEGGTSTAYNTTSDYRLKENVVSISDGITRLKTLKPKRFNFIESPTVTVDGFLAHEVTAVPEAISGEKDAMARTFYTEEDTIPEGKKVGDFKEYSKTEIDPQGLDQSKLVPLLTAALQEAVAKIEVLETKVAALEAASSN